MNALPPTPVETEKNPSRLDRVAGMAGWVRHKLGPLWWYSMLVFGATRVTDLLNLYYGMFFLPAALSANELGAVDPISRLAGFGGIPLSIVGIVAAKYLSVYHARGEDGKIKRFMRDMSWIALLSAALSVTVLLFAFDSIQTRLGVQSSHLLLGLSGVAVLACWQPLIRVVLQGMQRFYTTMVLGPLDPAMRLGLSVLLIPLFHLSGYLFAIFATGLATLAVGFWSLRKVVSKRVRSVSYREDWKGIAAFAWPVAIWTMCGSMQGFLEPFVVKHFLPVADAAGYYMVYRFGAIPSFLVGAVNFVLFPMLSQRHERGEDTGAYLRQATLVTAAVCAVGVIVLGFTSEWIFGLRPQWIPYRAYAPQVWFVGVMVTLDAVNSIYITHEIACRKFSFLWAVAPVVLAEGAILYCSFGWGAFSGLLSPDIWGGINDALPRTLTFALWIMVSARLVTSALLACHWGRSKGACNGN